LEQLEMNPGLELLTERQRQCLRLVYATFQVKEIARELGLSPNTVNEYLRNAREILGVRRSLEAARFLAEYEGTNRLVSKPAGVAAAAISASSHRAAQGGNSSTAVVTNRINLASVPRLALIVVIAWMLAALAGSLLMGANALTELFDQHAIDIADGPYR
jgi:DNA-binding CsgD family transcriptional regulator